MNVDNAMNISVIIPSLNQGNFLEATILSILNQKNADFELIIIDGGSSDNTIDIINKYRRDIKYWISEEDRGQSHALNKGLAVCSGEFVGWMNSDDIYWAGAFSEFTNSARSYPGYDIYYANKYNINKNDKILRKVVYARPVKGFMKFYSKHRGMTFCNQAAFFRTSVFRDIGGFDESFQIGMDLDFFFRCIMGGKKFHYTNSVWGAWRFHEAAKTATSFNFDNKRIEERKRFMQKHDLNRGSSHRFLTFVAGLWRRLIILTQ